MVLGEKAVPQNCGAAFYEVNVATRERAIYNFPKREVLKYVLALSRRCMI